MEKRNNMKCPYCGNEMQLGYIAAKYAEAPWWLPDNVDPNELGLWGLVTANTIRKAGGFFLGDATKRFAFTRKRVDSYWCQKCSLLITKI